MFSLQVAFILALSIQLDNFAVSGYAVDIPFTVTSIEDSSSDESNNSYETTTPCPGETLLNTPVIETTTAPTYDEFDVLPDARQFAVVQQNFNITGPSTRNRKRTSCLCKECNPENGFYIKHFRQYNYYYPHGRGMGLGLGHHMPHYVGLFSSEDFLPHDSPPFASSVVSANNVKVMSSSNKKSSRPTVRFSPPGVASYVPNNGFNSIYHNHQSSSGVRHHSELARSSSASEDEENLSQNGEQTSSDETSEQTSSQSTSHVESATTIPLDDNVSEDIISYLSEPNVYGHARMTTHTNGNGHNFHSQRVSLSSRLQSQSQSPPPPFGEENSEAQEQAGVSSSSSVQHSQSTERQQQVGPSSSTYQSSSEAHQQESVSSSLHHHSQPASNSEAEQQVSVSSKTQSPPVSSSESQQQQNKVSSSTYQSQNWPSYATSSIGDVNFGGSNSMTIGYNPHFQSPPFGVFSVVQPTLPPVPVSGLKSPIKWQGPFSKSPSMAKPHPQHKPNTCQYCNNRIRNWPNFSLPPPPPPAAAALPLPQLTQLPLFDFTNMSPSYSVIL